MHTPTDHGLSPSLLRWLWVRYCCLLGRDQAEQRAQTAAEDALLRHVSHCQLGIKRH